MHRRLSSSFRPRILASWSKRIPESRCNAPSHLSETIAAKYLGSARAFVDDHGLSSGRLRRHTRQHEY